MEFLNYPLSYHRTKTREVAIGDLIIGGHHPIYVQSMLTSSTQDVAACLEEIKSLLQVGCRLIRLTVPSKKDLDAVPELRRVLKEEGLDVLLVADIHFSPALAVEACELFEKVRINPGNFSDKPKNSSGTIDEQEFEEGAARLKEAIQPLVGALKKYGRALRIGVNQGSLSTRMMERYGDSPNGMVQSALEMAELFEEQGFDQLVISLKSSNPIVVQKAYRLLVGSQKRREVIPMHLGVTEAGDGIMGRIKSLAGIGPLLMDGIGDTVRVSLTEESANEIIFANQLLPAILREKTKTGSQQEFWQRPITHQRIQNKSVEVGNIQLGGGSPFKIGKPGNLNIPQTDIQLDPDFEYRESEQQNEVFVGSSTMLKVNSPGDLNSVFQSSRYSASALTTKNPAYLLRTYHKKKDGRTGKPIGYQVPSKPDYNLLTQLAAVLSEGLLDFFLLPEEIESNDLLSVLYLLQATRMKILVADYIACPSCGRTLFDIQSTSARIKEKTSHLKGIKIGIMGCIVNGPGEMADADFGYVGSGTGKIDLYFGQERVRRGISEDEAVDKLIELIKEKGFWQDKWGLKRTC